MGKKIPDVNPEARYSTPIQYTGKTFAINEIMTFADKIYI